MNGNVYVVMEPRKSTHGTVTKQHDISPANHFGEVIKPAIFPQLVVGADPAWMVSQAQKSLQYYSDDDSILAIGDPVAIGIVVAIAASVNGGRVSILRWSPKARGYERVTFDLNGGEENERIDGTDGAGLNERAANIKAHFGIGRH